MLVFKYQKYQLKHRRLCFILLCGCAFALISHVLMVKIFGISLLNASVNNFFDYYSKKETRQKYISKDSKEWFSHVKRNLDVLEAKLNESNATLNRLRQILNSLSDDS